jgi:GT2 family glycosyltransferase/tetratricopeptide (TPR) repeat protein/2-polyprenyl-3-methyl-5-hydroxy-6-metoxy-1,4-benzoquinol methylase
MSITRIALIYDDQSRPETTGTYCKRALSQLAEVRHYRPAEIGAISPREHDLYLCIDDGLRYDIPDRLRPAAWWMIDTHMDIDWYRGRAKSFDFVFAAQRDAVLQFQEQNICDAKWLPLACDPDIHCKHEAPKLYDVCFVGNVVRGIRADLLSLISQRIPRHFIGRCYFEEMAKMYSSSRIVFNRSVANDLNMRVFEGLACGSMLLTNSLDGSGQEDLFRSGIHLETYTCAEDLLDKIGYYLARDDLRDRIGSAGREEAVARHTYRHRMEEILLAAQRSSRRHRVPTELPPRKQTRADVIYYDMPRPEVLAIIPRTARRVLDVGCGAGNLGATLKARQPTEVVGIEVVPEIADIARSRLDQVIVGDIESLDLRLQAGSFDCVIFADVLEHLRDPLSVLRRTRDCVNGGKVIASIPNARHHSVVSSLLDGNWTYETAGLLDATHLRFFTRREIEKLFFRAGYRIEAIQPAPSLELQQWQETNCRREINVGGLHITGLSEEQSLDFYVTQYLVTAGKRQDQAFGLTSIVIPVHNQISYTRQCLENIRLRTDEPYEIIVVDNGSTDGTAQYLRSRSDVLLIENRENRGFSAACNQGIRASRGDQILLLNNDVVVTTGWLHRLLRALHCDPLHGIVGPSSNYCAGFQRIPVRYQSLSDLDGFAWDHGKACDGQCISTERIFGFCMLFRRELVERIGSLDERFGMGMYEDDDYCVRALNAGYRLAIARDSFVHHFGSRTFLANGVDMGEALDKNERIFRAKWQDDGRERQTDAKSTSLPRFAIKKSNEGCLQLQREKLVLSLCMIVRDNENTIEACLKSIKPWVDEMIVVDTGSQDATPSIARQCGASVYHFPWCDDFSAARNESLKYATGDWIFWMDSDDTISEYDGRTLRELVLNSGRTGAIGYVMQVRCPGEQESDCTIVDHVKLFRNRPGLRFEGRIHEQVLPSIRRAGGEVIFTDVSVLHSGTDNSPNGRQRKLDRDFRLIELDLAERPDHPFVLFNLGMTQADAGQHDKAVRTLRRCVDVSRPDESHLRKAYALLAGSLSSLGQYHEAWEVCQEGRRLYPDDAELLFREGIFHQHFGRLREAEKAYLGILAAGKPTYFTSIDKGIRGYKAHYNLALVYDQMGDLAKAEEQWREVVKATPTYPAGWYGLGESLVRQGKISALEALIAEMPDDNNSARRISIEKLLLRGHFASRRGRLDEAKQLFEQAVKLEPDNREAGHCLCRLLFENGDLSMANDALQTFLARFPDDGAAHHNLGVTHLQQGHHDMAATEFELSLRYRPNFPPTQALLNQLRDAMARGPKT